WGKDIVVPFFRRIQRMMQTRLALATGAWLCAPLLCLAFLPVRAFAEHEWKRRFLEEAPLRWKELDAANSHREGVFQLTRIIPGKKDPEVAKADFSINGNYAKIYLHDQPGGARPFMG